MKLHPFRSFAAAVALAAFLSGCASTGDDRPKRGPDGTIAYLVSIETSEPDVRIEANNEHIGMAPLTLKIFGDKDGTFHNFGSQDYIIRAIPKDSNKPPQTKVFRTGGWFSQEDRIPRTIYFDMNHKGGFTIDRPPRY